MSLVLIATCDLMYNHISSDVQIAQILTYQETNKLANGHLFDYISCLYTM